MNRLAEFSAQVHRLRSRMRGALLSRQPLELLRIELATNAATLSCDWLVRPVDRWDQFRPEAIRGKLQSEQVLHDALEMRKNAFRLFSTIRTLELRAFRENPGSSTTSNPAYELVLVGIVQRGDDASPRIPSLAMRAHLAGFQFLLADGILRAISTETHPFAARV